MQSHNTLPERIYHYDTAIHGSSKWADKAHLAERGYGEHGELLLGYGLPEHDKAGAYPVTLTADIHDITSGGTRSGKGTKAVILRFFHHGSIIGLGDKGSQNAAIAINIRLAMGRKVIVMGDPELAKDLGVTALGFDSIGMLNPNSDTFFDDAYADADALVEDTTSKERHWVDEAKALIAGLMMYISACPKALLPNPKKGKTMAQLRACLNLSRNGFMNLVGGTWEQKEDEEPTLIKPGMAQFAHEKIRNAANRLLGKNPKELSSILSVALNHTHWLESDIYSNMVSRGDFNLKETLLRGDTDIFVVTPIKRAGTARKAQRLLLNKIIQIFSDLKTKPTFNTRIILDEFLSMIGYMEVIEKAIALVAGKGLIFSFVIQSLSQLKQKYDSWELFLDNAYLQIISANSQFDCEYISKHCGNTTIELLTESTAEKRAELLSDPHHFTVQDRIMNRLLMTPEEVRQLHRAFQIVLLQNTRPALLLAVPYFIDSRLRDRKGKPIFGIDPDHAHKALPKPIDFTKKGLDLMATLSPYVIPGGTA